MHLVEGQIYAGEIGSFGGEDIYQHWIVIAPFGKTYLQSADEPMNVHFMPIHIAHMAIDSNQFRLIATNPHHPIICLQRAKEARNIRDTHMGCCGDNLNQMLALLNRAVADGADFAPYVAGEILAMLKSARYRFRDTTALEKQVQEIFAAMPTGPLPLAQASLSA